MEIDIDKLENLDRLRRLPPSEDSFECQGCGRLDTRCTCSETLANAAPALLAEIRRLRADLRTAVELLDAVEQDQIQGELWCDARLAFLAALAQKP